MCFSFIKFLQEGKKTIDPQTSFLMLEAKEVNSSATLKSSSIFEKMAHFLVLLSISNSWKW
jgi:hypothetical protein